MHYHNVYSHIGTINAIKESSHLQFIAPLYVSHNSQANCHSAVVNATNIH